MIGGCADQIPSAPGLVQPQRKVEVVVQPAPRIETGAAGGTDTSGVKVLFDRQLRAANSTEHRSRLEFLPRPRLQIVIGESIVALLASVVLAAAPDLDGDDVEFAPVMNAPRLRVELDAEDVRTVGSIAYVAWRFGFHCTDANTVCDGWRRAATTVPFQRARSRRSVAAELFRPAAR